MTGIAARVRRQRSLILVVAFGLVMVSLSPPADAKSERSTRTKSLSVEFATDSTTGETSSLESIEASQGFVMDGHNPGTPLSVGQAIHLVDRAGIPLVEQTGQGVQIALIDTGVMDVPGMRSSKVMIGPDFSFEDMDPELRARDTNGHGTHMGSIMVAADEAWTSGDRVRDHERMLGIAPDAELVSIKVATAEGAVDVTQVIAAINWVIEHHDDPGMNIRVLALAYGNDSKLTTYHDPLAHAVERAWMQGIVVVAAAGNLGNDTWQLRNPARDPYVIAVGSAEAASDGTATVSEYSNDGYGYRSVDVVAPGRSILGLRVPGSYSDQFNEAGRVGDDRLRGSGTSQATAIVAGAAALLLEARPELTPDEVKAMLIASAHPITNDKSLEGAGMIDICAALDTRLRGNAVQRHTLSVGTGSLDLARGSWWVFSIDGRLQGNQDIFGNDFSDSAWSVDAWSGNSWSGNSWSGNSWSGNSWSGNSWSGNSWSGNSWSGNDWS